MKVQITDDVTGAHHGQVDGALTASTEEHGVVGWLGYSLFRKAVHILIVETVREHRRQGVATQLVDRLYADNPGWRIDWGMTTTEGTAFKTAIWRRGNDV